MEWRTLHEDLPIFITTLVSDITVVFVVSSPVTGRAGPEGSRKLRLLDFLTTAQVGGKVVSLTHRPLFTPRKHTWYSFLLEAESTPGP